MDLWQKVSNSMIKKFGLIALALMIIAIIIMEALGYVHFLPIQSFRGLVAIILAVFVLVSGVYAIFGQSPQRNVKIGSGIRLMGDNSSITIIEADDDELKEKYITSLEQRIDEIKEQLADKDADNEVLKAELRDLQAKLDNREQHFQQRVQALVSAEQSLRELQLELPEKKFNEALVALQSGDTSKVDQLLAQVEADNEKYLLHAAKAAYQRGLIANNEIRYDDASVHFTRAVALDPDNADYLNQAAILRDTMGLYQEAEPLYHKALAIRKQALGENHPDTATSYNNIASNLGEQGRYEEAEPTYHKALTIRKQLLGENHPDTAISYNNIAGNLAYQGRYEEAEPMYHKALAVFKQVLGENHPSTASSYNNIASNLAYQGRYEEAEPMYQQALAIYKQTLGENHPLTATSYGNLASNLAYQGRYEEAEPLYQQALAIMKAISLADHPNTKVMRDGLRVAQEKIQELQTGKEGKILPHNSGFPLS
jgi:tetratricopeptide (TPR) repeat protein